MAKETWQICRLGFFLLLTALLFALFTGGACADGDPWTETGRLPAESDLNGETTGSYYLTEDVVFSDTWTVPQTINLDLNGKSITFTGSEGSVITVPKNATLNLYDSSENNGGTITGGKGGNKGGVLCGGGVYVCKGGALNMHGGRITGNSADRGGGVYLEQSPYTTVSYKNFTMTGGMITGNTATAGGGVYAPADQDQHVFHVTLQGTPVITGNTGGNLYLVDYNAANPDIITIGGSFEQNASVGVTLMSGYPASATGVFTDTGKFDYYLQDTARIIFQADDPYYGITVNENGAAQISSLTPIVVNFGDNHEELAAMLDGTYNCSVDGALVTIKVASQIGWAADDEINSRISAAVQNFDSSDGFADNGEQLYSSKLNLKPMSSYTDEAAFETDLAWRGRAVTSNMQLCLQWRQAVTEAVTVSVEPLVCGTECRIENYGSIATDHSVPLPAFTVEGGNVTGTQSLSSWYESYDPETMAFGAIPVGVIRGGQTYYARFYLSAPFGRFIPAESVSAGDGNACWAEPMNNDLRMAVAVPAVHTFAGGVCGACGISDGVLTLPASLKSIEESAFEGAAAGTVFIPDGCERIGANAFKNCGSFLQVHIPASVSSIDESAFDGCEMVWVFGTAGSTAEDFCSGKENINFLSE